ncbi:MAG: hypothetical protein ABR612_13065 [Chromatocurvus sp.]
MLRTGLSNHERTNRPPYHGIPFAPFDGFRTGVDKLRANGELDQGFSNPDSRINPYVSGRSIEDHIAALRSLRAALKLALGMISAFRSPEAVRPARFRTRQHALVFRTVERMKFRQTTLFMEW